MLDESMPDWEECIIAVMENEQEQDFYYGNSHTYARKTLMENSKYNYDDNHVEFWFPYKMDGYNYADEIAKNMPQCACDADYADFELIEP